MNTDQTTAAILRMIPIRGRAIASRLLPVRRLLLAGRSMRAWFGLRPKAMIPRFLGRGILTFSYEEPGWIGGDDERLETISESTGRSLALYPTCLEEECTVSELRELDPTRVVATSTKYLRLIQAYAARCDRAIDASKPHAIVLVQGYEPFAAAMRAVAVQRNIPAIAFENTALSDRMLWDDQSAITTNRNLARNFFWRFSDGIPESESEVYCERLIAETKSRKSGEHQSPPQAFERDESRRPLVLFIGQVYTDSSIIFGIGEWGTPVRLIRELAQLAQRQDFDLVIKLHPKEIGGSAPFVDQPYRKLTYRKLLMDPEIAGLMEAGGRVRVDHENEYDTYSLMAVADAAVTVNSQAGLEAAIRGVPTVVCGEAFYANLGFTRAAADPDSLALAVNRCLGANPAESLEWMKQARKFAYIHFEKYCIAKSPSSVASLVYRRCFRAGEFV